MKKHTFYNSTDGDVIAMRMKNSKARNLIGWFNNVQEALDNDSFVVSKSFPRPCFVRKP